jgi:hypothetical protein
MKEWTDMAALESRMQDLAERAAEANERVQASLGATKEKLQAQVAKAGATIERTNRELEAKATAGEPWKRWTAARQSWNEHTAEIRRTTEAVRAIRRAEWAEANAVAAIDFAYLTLQQAEYQVLDAVLARAEADELAAKV